MSVTFEQQIIKNLLCSDGYLGGSSKKIFQKNQGYLLGSKKGFVVYNLEKVVFTYVKVLSLVRNFKKRKLKILFIGCPFGMEKKIEKLLSTSRHFFISSTNWVHGSLSNNRLLSTELSMVITFNQSLTFSNREFFNKELTLISFVEENEKLSFIDFSLVISLRSKSIADMYYFLLKQSV